LEAFEIGLLALAAFSTSALTAVVGAGGGTALIALMLLIMPPAAVIPAHGVVQLAANVTRSWLLRRYLAWPIIWRFSLLLPLGVVIGLWLFQGLPAAVIQLLIGGFVLITLALPYIKQIGARETPLWAFIPVGFVTGCLNMIVGVIAPILGAIIVRRDLKKEEIVGTLGFFGVIGNLFKIIGFTFVGFSFAKYWPLLAVMVPAAVLGARVGRMFLSRVDERLFLICFRLMLCMLALKLIIVDGLSAFLS
jgi:uncharacterized membrane protein YfcA